MYHTYCLVFRDHGSDGVHVQNNSFSFTCLLLLQRGESSPSEVKIKLQMDALPRPVHCFIVCRRSHPPRSFRAFRRALLRFCFAKTRSAIFIIMSAVQSICLAHRGQYFSLDNGSNFAKVFLSFQFLLFSVLTQTNSLLGNTNACTHPFPRFRPVCTLPPAEKAEDKRGQGGVGGRGRPEGGGDRK